MRDEYEEQEQLDAVEVIAWLARQPWCAATWECSESHGWNQRAPGRRAQAAEAEIDPFRVRHRQHLLRQRSPTLGAASPISRWFGAPCSAQLRRPPDPAVVGERWRAMWQERLANDAMPLENSSGSPALRSSSGNGTSTCQGLRPHRVRQFPGRWLARWFLPARFSECSMVSAASAKRW